MHNTAYIAMGANLPFRGLAGGPLLSRAVTAIERAGLVVLARSGVWVTAPWPPGAEQPDYFNAVIFIDSSGHSPRSLYDRLRAIETTFGRDRRERWAPRTLDLDIVAMGERAGVFDGIILPHERIQERAFVLAPMAEVAPAWRHPVTGKAATDMLEELPPGQGYRRLRDGWS